MRIWDAFSLYSYFVVSDIERIIHNSLKLCIIIWIPFRISLFIPSVLFPKPVRENIKKVCEKNNSSFLFAFFFVLLSLCKQIQRALQKT